MKDIKSNKVDLIVSISGWKTQKTTDLQTFGKF
jgi:hypothetical protein